MTLMNRATRPFFAGFLAVFGLLALAACSTPMNTSGPAKSYNRLAADDEYAAGFENIADKYIHPVNLNELGLEGLRGLGAIDPAITAERDGKDVVLLVDGHEVMRKPAPGSDNARGWAALTTDMTFAARKASGALGRAGAEQIYQAVFDGLLSRLDLYSRYAGAKEARRNRARRDGFGGIGVHYQLENDGVRITDVMPDTPAARAGLAVGDLVTDIDGKSLAGLDSDAVAQRLHGPSYTQVTLTVERNDVDGSFGVELERAHIVPQTVYASVVDRVAVIRVSSFNENTANSMERKLTRILETHRLKGIVLDLRSNPGGLLRQSVEVADLLLTGGRIISTRGRNPDSMHDYRAEAHDITHGLPLVTLVDGRSASAAEIVAAALQDDDRTVIVGTNSFGKGTVQTVIRLPNDGELTLTWSRFITPSGYVLHGLGVLPAVCTSGEAGHNPAAYIRTALKDMPEHVAWFHDWRRPFPIDATERQKLRAECPKERHRGNFDLTLARRIITEPSVYSRLLAMSRVPTESQAAELRRQSP